MKTAKLIKKIQLTNDVIELNFEAGEPLDFKSGQYLSIRVDDVEKSAYFRAYSISSMPRPENKNFSLCIKIFENSRAGSWLNSLKENNSINFMGPIGTFLFNENTDKSVIFVATGTGIAPLKAMVEEQLAKNSKKQMKLIFGLRHATDVFYKEYFENLAAAHPNFTFILTLSRPEDDDWKGKTGRVSGILENMDFDPNNTEFYLCGLKDMIGDVTEILEKRGVKEENVHFEKYD